MKKHRHLPKCGLVLLAASLVGPLAGQDAPESPRVQIPIEEFRLDNGLRVVLSEDRSAPTYSICVTYNVGSRDENPGRTGLAHLLEHMMFQGSENVGKGEHFILIQANGGRMNGSTGADHTNYYAMLPSNQLDLGLFLEADRMRSLAINPANLDNQRQAVAEERRQRYDNQPYGWTSEAVIETAYDNFGYKHATIGRAEDLDNATVDDMADLYRLYYAPNNAVLSLVGDFDTRHALDRVKTYFGNIPSQPAPPDPIMTEREQEGERRRTLEDRFARLARLDIAYKIPPGNTLSWYVMRVLNEIMAGGRSSRLYRRLVEETEVATSVSGRMVERRGPSMTWFVVRLRPGTDPNAVERLIYEEIERVREELVADDELEKARMQLWRRNARRLQRHAFTSDQNWPLYHRLQ